jgi:hypothetical protein
LSLLFLACLAGLVPSGVLAQESGPHATRSATPASTDPCAGNGHLLATLDRPTIGFSPCVETRGKTLLEIGYQNQSQGTGTLTRSVQYTVPIVRIGIADRIELDLIPPNFSVVRSSGAAAMSGYNDAGLGAKFEFPPSARGAVAIDTLLTFPSGTGGFSSGSPVGAVNLDASSSLGPVFGVGTTLGFASIAAQLPSGAVVRSFAFLPSAVVTAQLPGTAQFYLELAHNSRIAPGASSRTILNGGVQKLLGHGVEVDIEIGQTLNNGGMARFHYLGFGLGLER